MAFSMTNVFKNDNMTKFAIFLTVALSIGYLTNKQYEAIIFLYAVAGVMYFICKNVMCSLGISIILTNLLLSMDFFTVTENFAQNLIKDKLKKKEKKKESMVEGKVKINKNDFKMANKNKPPKK